VSDTPRTYAAWETLPSVYEFIAETRRMERELNEVNAKIKRLEREVELFREYSDYGDVGVVDSILRGEEMERKEAKL
jgi:uncharacterized protein YeeX (DUF496 family)